MSQTPHSPSLSEAQLATLAEIGEERRANAGDVLYRVGDRDYPFVAIIDGEVAILMPLVTRLRGTAPRSSSAR
jgi:hypothetical protein